jgi:hypothetical protein
LTVLHELDKHRKSLLVEIDEANKSITLPILFLSRMKLYPVALHPYTPFRASRVRPAVSFSFAGVPKHMAQVLVVWTRNRTPQWSRDTADRIAKQWRTGTANGVVHHLVARPVGCRNSIEAPQWFAPGRNRAFASTVCGMSMKETPVLPEHISAATATLSAAQNKGSGISLDRSRQMPNEVR